MLMTVGIARRVSDYGWTPNRCYILLLNLWFYGVYAWQFVVRGRRVKWIAISAVVVALVSSVGPWSLARVEPREDPEAAAAIGAEDDDEKAMEKRFNSRNKIREDEPLSLRDNGDNGGNGGVGFDNILMVWWSATNSPREEKHVDYRQEGDDLVIRLAEGNREFRVPMRQATESAVVRGDDFVFVVQSCSGFRKDSLASSDHGSADSLSVNFLHGYLLW
jgi:hypothetical protein